MLVIDRCEDLLVVVLFLWLGDLYEIGQRLTGALLVRWVVGLHDFNLNTHNSLLEEDVSDGNVHEVKLRLTRRNHIARLELHRFGTLLLELAGDDDLAALGLLSEGLLDHRVSSQPDGDLVDELQLECFSEGSSTESLVDDPLNGERDAVLAVTEPLLDDALELPHLPVVVLQQGLDLGGLDSDFGLGHGGELEPGVADVVQGAGEEAVEFCLEHTISDEFLLSVHLAD